MCALCTSYLVDGWLLTYLLQTNVTHGVSNMNSVDKGCSSNAKCGYACAYTCEKQCSFICLTLKLLKHPKSHHISSAISDALEELQVGLAECLRLPIDKVILSEWKNKNFDIASDKDAVHAPDVIADATIYYSCVHLCANSINERTLLIKIVC